MSNPIGDRHLLFGILALQKNIISREVLLAAMKAWAFAPTVLRRIYAQY